MNKNMQKESRGNRLKRGSISVIYTVVFVVLVIALNLVVSSVAGSINLNIDLTAEEFISIGEVSRNVLGGLEEAGDLEATIYLLADRDAYDSYTQPTDAYGNPVDNGLHGLNPLALVRDLCEEYSYEYSGIKVEYKNLTRDPEWATRYNEITNTTLTSNNIIIEGKYHARVLTLDAFLMIDSETNTFVGFNGELRITTALLQSCVSEPQVVTFTKGHGEPAQVSEGKAVTALANLLMNAGFEVLETDLASQEIDPRTKIMIVNDPTKDFTAEEVEKLMDYTDSYNNLIVMVDDQTPVLPNLSDFLSEEWGLGYKAYHQISHATENFGNDPLNLSAKCYTDMANPDNSAAYQIIKSLATNDIRLVMPHSVELYATPAGTKDDYTVETVLTSGSGASSINSQAGLSETGTYPLILLSANGDYVNLEDENSTNQVMKYQYVMLVGSTDFAGTGSVDAAAFGNGALMLSTARTMGVERYSLDIDYKAINDVALAIETSVATRLGIIICAVLPTLILIAGLVVFVRRRHL
ncbi:MAG: Gldg family protein [Clostridia bacterium]|nr:Gldg family protein [Clostridia bacterium]